MNEDSECRTILLGGNASAGMLIRWEMAKNAHTADSDKRCSGAWALDARSAHEFLGSIGAPDVNSHWARVPVLGRFANLPEIRNSARNAHIAAVAGLLEADRIRVMREGEPVDTSEFDRSERVASFGRARIDPLPLRKLLAAGGCLSIFGVQEFDPSIAGMCVKASAASGARVGASLFYSPPNSTGYPPHYDEFHSLLVQIEGGKLWSVRDGPVLDPAVGHSWPKLRPFYPHVPDDVGEYESEVLEFDLQPGMALWIPAGCIHSGIAGPLGSTHVTLNFNAWHVFELVQMLAGDSGSVAGLRRGVVADEMTPRAVLEEVCNGLESLATIIRSDTAIGDRLLERMLFNGPPVPYTRGEVYEGLWSTSDLDTPLAVRHCASCAEFHLGDRIVQVPASDPLFERMKWEFDARSANGGDLSGRNRRCES